MEIPNVEQLLDYVFTPEDFTDDPTTQEYKKLVRVMKARPPPTPFPPATRPIAPPLPFSLHRSW